MSITFPRTDLLSSVGFADQTFDLILRQELSRQANGVTRTKDLGSGLWTGAYTTTLMRFSDALAFEAKLKSLDGAINAFEAYDLRRPAPLKHMNENFSDTATIHTVGANNKSLRLTGLPSGFQITPGDYVSIDAGGARHLLQAVEAATASSGGLTGLFEVRPHLRPGVVASLPVRLKKASCYMILQPGSVTSEMANGNFNVVKFGAVQAL